MKRAGGRPGRWLVGCVAVLAAVLLGCVASTMATVARSPRTALPRRTAHLKRTVHRKRVVRPTRPSPGITPSHAPSAETSSVSSIGGSGASLGIAAGLGSGSRSEGAALLGSLVVPGMEPLEGGELARDERQARLASPEAVFARERSRTEFEHLGAAAAVRVAREGFPSVVDEPAGGPPSLPVGERVVKYEADNVAALSLTEGKHGVVESLGPIATPSGHGQFTPINLALHSTGNGYAPANSDVAVQIPKHASGGVSMPGDGVSLTPENAHGQSLGGSEGVQEGASVLYANTQTDTDTLAKPTTGGFELDSLLRSVDSPETLYFKVGMPAGARLEEERGLGAGRVVLDGQTIAAVAVPGAEDAAGTSVLLSVSVTGSTLVVRVKHRSGEYDYPIEVDPVGEAYDWRLLDKGVGPGGPYEGSNWRAYPAPPSKFHFTEEGTYESSGYIEDRVEESHSRGEKGLVAYETDGASRITRLKAEVSGKEYPCNPEYQNCYHENPEFENKLFIRHGTEVEAEKSLPGTIHERAEEEVSAGTGHNGNDTGFEQIFTRPEAPEKVSEGLSTQFGDAYVYIDQAEGPKDEPDSSDYSIKEYLNADYKAGTQWFSPTVGSPVIAVTAKDPGIGIYKALVTSPTEISANNPYKSDVFDSGMSGCHGVQCFECWEWSNTCEPSSSKGRGATGEPLSSYEPMTFNVAPLSEGKPKSWLPNGENTVTIAVEDAAELKSSTTETIKVDGTPPHNIVLSGLPSGNEISEGEYHIKAEATDGEGTTKSAGMKSIALLIDGQEVGSASGSSCQVASGPCTAHNEWTIVGRNYASGKHVATVVATDNAGNVETSEVTFTVHPAMPVALGPGSVNPQTGNYTLSTSDVSQGGLSVSRSYSSRHLEAGSEGPLGPEWSLNMGPAESLMELPNGNMTLTESNGAQAAFAKTKTPTYESPNGDSNLKLTVTENEAKTEKLYFLLENAADHSTTKFTLPSSGAKVWAPTRQEGAAPSNVVMYTYRTSEGITEPTEALAPPPPGVKCPEGKLNPGCRALKFVYAENTKEHIGEAENEWGEYKGRLKQVLLEAYNPATKKVEEPGIPVGEYSYDKLGRLRAEWDPQVKPKPLKTTYGYDAEGHVTALTPPGQESWAFTYGTIAGDMSPGRLLKATQAPVSAGLWKGEAVKDTEAPKITGTPAVGVRLAVSNGVWSGGPVVYAYQWEDCNSSGGECSAIAGATNPNYTLASTDLGHELVVQVTAINGDGSVLTTTLPSGVVESRTTEYPVEEAYFGVAAGADGNLWLTQEYWGASGAISKVTPKGEVTTYKLSTPFCGPNYITPGPASESALWFTDVCAEAIGKITTSGTTTDYKVPSGATLRQITAGPDGNLWFAEETAGKIGKITTSGTITEYELPKGSDPYGIAPGPSKESALWFTDRGTSKIGKITTAGVITEYELPKGSGPAGIVAGPDGNLWFADEDTSKIGKITTSGTISEYAVTGGSPYNVAAGPDGNLWFTAGTNKIDRFTTAGAISEYTLPAGSNPSGITAGPEGSLWFAEMGTSKIGKLPIESEGEARAPQPGTTIEYNVPLSVSGRQSLAQSEVEKWGQTDDPPVEAAAIFPPDSPQGWPASSYTRATIDYLDGKGRIVNVSAPTGGVSTTEYNKTNDVVRTLSPDNRAQALKEAKPAEAAKLLSTESKYNGETKEEVEKEEAAKNSAPGTELLEALGPRHAVKLASGKEVLARSHVVYTYDEGAPTEGGPYRLVTKVTQGAQVEGEGEQEVRTTTNSYGGQGNLGWTLRKPTSVTADPKGLKLTHTTLYNEETGDVIETRMPMGSGSGSPVAPVYMSQLGSLGSGGGQLHNPIGDAVDSSGNVWVVDDDNNRIEKFSSSGAFMLAVGWGVKDGKAEEETCTTGCQAGIAGSGKGQFNGPTGIAINQSTGHIYVCDYSNSRVEEFSSTGTFLAVIGSLGTGEGQFEGPTGATIEPATGDLWVADNGNYRVEKFSSTGKVIAVYGSKGTGNGQFNSPYGIVFDDGELYVTDYENARVQELSTSGAYVGQFGTKGAGNGQFSDPTYIAADPVSGTLYVTDNGNYRVEQFSVSGTYLTQFGGQGAGNGQFSSPKGVAVNAAGGVYVVDSATNERLQQWEPVPSVPVYASQFGTKGSGAGQVSSPEGAAIDAKGDVWVADFANNRIDEFSAVGVFTEAVGFGVGSKGEEKLEICTSSCKAGKGGTGNGQFSSPIAIAASGTDLYVADHGNNRIEELTEAGVYVTKFGSKGEGVGQMQGPVSVAIGSTGNVWVADLSNSRLDEFSSSGTPIEAVGFGVGSKGEEKLETCTSTCKAGIAGSGNGQFQALQGIAVSGGNVYIADYGNSRVQELTEGGVYVNKFGSKGTGNGQFQGPQGIATSSSTGNLYVTDVANGRVEEFTPSGAYLTQFGLKGSGNGQLKSPEGVAVNSSGDIYVVDSGNNRAQEWTPAPRPGNEGTHDTQTIYYTAGTEASVAVCQDHPEWAGWPCETAPAAQPQTSGSPELPVTTINSYNVYGEPLISTSTSGTASRTTTMTYDEAGRSLTSHTVANVGKLLGEVSVKYSETTGIPIEQLRGGEALKGSFNTLGQMVSYTDATGKITTYEYEGEGAYKGETERDARLKAVNDGEGVETFAYNTTTGALSEQSVAGVGAFTGSYDVEGNMTSKGYPNGMTATYTHNPVGETTGLVYKKETHCSSNCEWFTDNVVPSIHGQWLAQTTSQGKDTYGYDAAGRLIEATQWPTGKTCTTRVYGYDEDTNRTSLTTYPANGKGECSESESPTVEAHSYDAADRLVDPGVVYEPFGNTEKLPAIDAGGTESSEGLTSEFYVDNQVATQTQGGQTIGNNLDPSGRTSEIVSTGKVAATETQHYSGPGSAPAWTGELSGNTTREIGAMGGLVATQHDSETPILQLANLHGDIVATAKDEETAGLESTITEPTEYGVPATGAPPKYSWLGADELRTELPSGVVAMGARSYVPQLGRFLQTDPVPGGSANAYAYTHGNPVNESDPSGELTYGLSSGELEGSEAAGQRVVERERGVEEEERRKWAEERHAQEETSAREEARRNAELAYYEEGGPALGGEEGSGYGGQGRFRNQEDPGVPSGYICNVFPKSKWGSKTAWCEKYLGEESSSSFAHLADSVASEIVSIGKKEWEALKETVEVGLAFEDAKECAMDGECFSFSFDLSEIELSNGKLRAPGH